MTTTEYPLVALRKQVQGKASARSRPLLAITGDEDEGDREKGEREGPLSSSTLAATSGGSSSLGLLGKRMPYCLRVHLFQCRGLPSSEASGLLDPYIKVSLSSMSRECMLLSMHPSGTWPEVLRTGFPADVQVTLGTFDLPGMNASRRMGRTNCSRLAPGVC